MNDTEKLKKVAERLGYKIYNGENYAHGVAIESDDDRFYYKNFDPSTIPAQLVECIEWLGNKRYWFIKYPNGSWRVVEGFEPHCKIAGAGDTLADAAINTIAGEDDD